MKEVIIRDLDNKIISDKNIPENLEEFLDVNKKNNTWGRPERWVLATEPHDEADVLSTEIRVSKNGIPEEWVKLKAEYTIIIEDYNPVPQSVSPMQIRLALNELGLRQTIEDAVVSGSQDLKDMWKFASEFKRDYPLIEELSVSLGFTKEQVDNIFRLASTK